jgi:hypothetical protein
MQYCQLNCFFTFNQFFLDMYFACFCNNHSLQLIICGLRKKKPEFFMAKKIQHRVLEL